MDNVAQEGKTILFVSHNIAAVSALYPNAILLENGFFKAYGDSNEIIKKYTLENTKQIAIAIAERTDRDGEGSVNPNVA